MQKSFKLNYLFIGTVSAFMLLALTTVYFATEAYELEYENENLKRELTQVDTEMTELEGSWSQIFGLSHNLYSLTRTQRSRATEGKTETALVALRAKSNINKQEGESFAELLNKSPRSDYSVIDRFREMNDRSKELERKLRGLSSVVSQREELLASIPSISPVEGWISSSFGQRISPFDGRRVMHQGIDIGAPRGTRVHSTADGTVVFAGDSGNFGRTVVIDHGFGLMTRYAHNSRVLVKKGERVGRGEAISVVGNTGRSTGPHLHYEVIIEGRPVDPKNFLLDVPTDVLNLAEVNPRRWESEQLPMGGESSLNEIESSTESSDHRFLFPIKLAMVAAGIALICLFVPLIRSRRLDEENVFAEPF